MNAATRHDISPRARTWYTPSYLVLIFCRRRSNLKPMAACKSCGISMWPSRISQFFARAIIRTKVSEVCVTGSTEPFACAPIWDTSINVAASWISHSDLNNCTTLNRWALVRCALHLALHGCFANVMLKFRILPWTWLDQVRWCNTQLMILGSSASNVMPLANICSYAFAFNVHSHMMKLINEVMHNNGVLYKVLEIILAVCCVQFTHLFYARHRMSLMPRKNSTWVILKLWITFL